MASAPYGVNTIIQDALGNTGGNTGQEPPFPTTAAEVSGTPGNEATPAPPAPAAPEPFDPEFDYRTLPPEEQAAYQRWHGAYTRKRQKEAEEVRQMQERLAGFDAVPSEALQIAQEYATRLQAGDVLGVEQLLNQQLQAINYLKAQQGLQPTIQPGYPPQGYEAQDPYYEPPDPVQARLDAIETNQRMWQASQELFQLQAKVGKLTPVQETQMVAAKQQHPNLSMEQIHRLLYHDQILAREREAARQAVLATQAQTQALPPPPAGVPNRQGQAPREPTSRMGYIQAAIAEHLRG